MVTSKMTDTDNPPYDIRPLLIKIEELLCHEQAEFIDWALFQRCGPDYDPNYKPEFPDDLVKLLASVHALGAEVRARNTPVELPPPFTDVRLDDGHAGRLHKGQWYRWGNPNKDGNHGWHPIAPPKNWRFKTDNELEKEFTSHVMPEVVTARPIKEVQPKTITLDQYRHMYRDVADQRDALSGRLAQMQVQRDNIKKERDHLSARLGRVLTAFDAVKEALA